MTLSELDRKRRALPVFNACPFCGGEAHVDEHADHWSVVCGECQACVGYVETEECAIAKWSERRPTDQHLFTNMLRSLFNIDGHLLPELTTEDQHKFVRDPVRYFMGTDRAEQNAIFREIMKRQVRS